jgi:conjugative relaxase-like TrwC/TraI family protein
VLVIGPPAHAAYYWEKGVRARWLGNGMAGLGDIGPPSPIGLQRLLNGLDLTGQLLWPTAGGRRRLGHDLVFASPKPISLLWALGPPEITEVVEAAHEDAVRDAFDYLERQAAWVRRGATGWLVPSTGLVAAAFRHTTSRASDPHLHTHVVVANAARDLQGHWSSLDSRWLFAEARAAGALYQAGLRHYLDTSGLHLRWHVRPDGLGVIEGVGDDVVAEFSRRRRQLLTEAAATGRPARRPGRLASLVTRPVRPVCPAPGHDWHERARRVGFDANRFRLAPSSFVSPTVAWPDTDDLLGSSGVTARQALFTRRDLVRALAARLPRGAPAARIEAEVDRILASSAVVRVTPAQPAGVSRPRLAARFTTPELAALEDRLVADVERSARLGFARLGSAVTSASVSANPSSRPTSDWSSLTNEQRRIVRDLVAGAGPLAIIRARPGPATWAVLDAAASGWQAADPDRPVVAIVPSETEARHFEAATGIDTRLVADGHQTGPPAVVVIPGAQRLGTRMIAVVLDRAAARGDTVVLVDGTRRPAALEGRDLLSRLAATGAGRGRLDDPALREHDGPARRLDQLDSARGSVTLCPDTGSRIQAAVEDWAGHGPGRGRLEARHWTDADDLNRRARNLLALTGPAVKAGGREYCAGEPVIVRRSSPPLGLTRGRTGTVVRVDPPHRRLSILFAGDKRPIELDARRVGPTVLSHAYAVIPGRRQRATGPVFTLDSAPRL